MERKQPSHSTLCSLCLKGLVHPQKTTKPLILRFDCVVQTLILTLFWVSFYPQANNTMQVNSLQIPESDIMGTNGVIHFVNHILYPGGKCFHLYHYKCIVLTTLKTKTDHPCFQKSPSEARVSSCCWRSWSTTYNSRYDSEDWPQSI